MKIFEKDGYFLSYRDEGEGKPVVMLHGLGGDCNMFDMQIETFKDKYRIISPSLIGSGESSKLKVRVKEVLRFQTESLLVLLEDLGIEKAVFCGTSYGGIICQYLAINFPERVEGLVLTDTFASTKIKNIQDALTLVSIYGGLWVYYWHGLLKNTMRTLYKGYPEAQKYMMETMSKLRSREAVLQRRAINNIEFTKDLEEVTLPAMLLVGDKYKTLIKCTEEMNMAMKNSRMYVIDNSGDPSNLVNYERYNMLLGKFLSEIYG